MGISIARRNPRGRQVILDSVCDYLESRHLSLDAARAVGFADDYVLDGYGSYSRGILDTIHSVLLKDGIALDTTYTGKAFWGCSSISRSTELQARTFCSFTQVVRRYSLMIWRN